MVVQCCDPSLTVLAYSPRAFIDSFRNCQHERVSNAFPRLLVILAVRLHRSCLRILVIVSGILGG